MSFEEHDATPSSFHSDARMYLQNIRTAHVRWPARPAVRRRRMIFLVLFASRQKEHEGISFFFEIPNSLTMQTGHNL